MGSIFTVVLGERTNATSVVLGTLLGQETQTTTSGSFEFSVRPENQNINVSKDRAKLLGWCNHRGEEEIPLSKTIMSTYMVERGKRRYA
jgi:hypothetical protein